MKRIFLFLLTNIAVLAVLSVTTSLLGVNRYLTAQGIDYTALLAFCAVFGFGGSFISLLLSKFVDKRATGAAVITGREHESAAWLVSAVSELSRTAGIRTPEVAVFEGAPNAFATGAFKNSALVAVSTGLLQTMDREQVKAVLAHEISHIANGDMQTRGLLQGVVNTFVMFLARVVGLAVDRVLLRNEERGVGIGYYASVFVLEILFGLLASVIVMAFSRHREFRADWGAAKLMGTAVPMRWALLKLAQQETELPEQVAAFGVTGGISKLGRLFRSHPDISERVKALEAFDARRGK